MGLKNDYLNNLFNLRDKVAVITGGNGQLGSEYAKALLSVGARVVVLDTTDGMGERLADAGGSLMYLQTDITDKKKVERALEAIEEKWEAPHILINNAALDSPPGANPEENRSFEKYSLESWQSVLGVNLTGPFICCQVFGGKMAELGRGSIINISSTYGLVSPNQGVYKYREEKEGVPFVKPISYSATKSAVLNFTRYLATYWAKKGVRVNTLIPGGVFNGQDQEFINEYKKLVPMGRMARGDEYNAAVLFLSSDASSYMTGASLVIDGGWTAW